MLQDSEVDEKSKTTPFKHKVSKDTYDESRNDDDDLVNGLVSRCGQARLSFSSKCCVQLTKGVVTLSVLLLN